jgi:outer membrane immunogenic protein
VSIGSVLKKLLLAAVSSIAGLGPVFAGDLPLPIKAPPPFVIAAYDWSGFYIGGHVGGAFESSAFQDPSLAGTLICCELIGTEGQNATVPNGSAGSFLGGAQAGWNYQIGQFVFGSEIDFSRANLNSTRTGTAPAVAGVFPSSNPATESFSIHTDWTATATLNAGIANDRWLWYGKAGAALAHDTYGLGLNSTFNCFGCAAGPLSFTSTGAEIRPGWTLGAGMAWAFSGSWVATIEYDYLYFAAKPVDFSGTIFSGVGPYAGATLGTNTSQQISELKLGLDYKFGSATTAAPGSSFAGTTSHLFAAATSPLFDSVSTAASGYNWSGFYAGGHLGGGWQRTDFQDSSAGGVLGNCCVMSGNMAPGSSAPTAFGGSFLGGAQVGWNYQVDRLVVGVNGDFTATNLSTTNVGVTPGGAPGTAIAATESFGLRTDWTATATALFGVTNDRWLFYSKFGAAWAHDNYSLSVTGPNTCIFCGAVGSFSFAQGTSEIRTGLAVGTGLSWAQSANWVASIEYDFLYFPNKEVDFTGPVTNAVTGAGAFTGPATFTTNSSQQISEVKLALDYKFTPGGGTAQNGPFFASASPVFVRTQRPAVGHDWSGVYVGGHVGGGLTNVAMQDPSLAGLLADCCYGVFTQFISNAAIPNANGGAFLGGAQAGWNYQVGRFIIGGDFDFSETNMKANATGVSQATAGLGANETLSVRTDWTATATATFGYAALDRLLWYNKVGIAWAHDSYGYSLSGIGTNTACCGPVGLTPFAMQSSAAAIVTGWTIGTGFAWALTDKWSARIEYDYLNFGSKSVDFSGVIPANLAGVTNPFTSNTMFSQQISEVKLGVNYKFASGVPFL